MRTATEAFGDAQAGASERAPTRDAQPAASARPSADAAPRREPTITRSGFLDAIDLCVRYLAAWLGGSTVRRSLADASAAELARVQLWQWLHAGDAVLADGTPVNFALFDAAIQRVGERLPRRGLPGQENVTQAAWLLAELTHSRTLNEFLTTPAHPAP